MKRLALALVAAAGLATTAARADHVSVYGGVTYGAPAYAPAPMYGPVYAPPARGFWRDESFNVWVPPHWEVRTDYWGRRFNRWEPGHYEVRTRRVWVDAGRERHEWMEHERREHERRDWDDRDRR